jgi:hypothetical protein
VDVLPLGYQPAWICLLVVVLVNSVRYLHAVGLGNIFDFYAGMTTSCYVFPVCSLEDGMLAHVS